jgi:urea transport system permease protein
LTAIALLAFAAVGDAAAVSGSDAEVRKKLAAAVLAKGPEQRQLLKDLGDTGSKLARDVLSAWPKDRVILYDAADGSKVPALLDEDQDSDGKVRAARIDNGEFIKDDKGQPARFASTDFTTVDTDASLRSAIQLALDALALSNPNPDARRTAILKLGNSQKLQNIPVLEERLGRENDPDVKKALLESIALLQLGDTNRSVQLGAIESLGHMQSIVSLDMLKRLAAKGDLPPDLSKALAKAVSAIEGHISSVNFIGTIFHGVSAGSILLVVALGLAITFGLMGIINMAHGEMIAVGAYTCYVVQNIFGSGFGFSITLPFSFGGKAISFGLHLPGINAGGWLYESYFLFAIPLSFAMAALAGLAIERLVIRFLYRRPLESLLATWGV